MTDAMTEPQRVWTVGTAPGIFPFAGHAIALFRRPLDFLNSLPAHGDLVAIRLGPVRAWMACHPQVAHQVLMDPHTFDKGGPLFDRLRALMGNGLVTCRQDTHRRQRRLLQPAFRAARIAEYARLTGREAQALCREWRPGQQVDVTAAMMALTTRVTSAVLFSGSLDAERAATVRECLEPVVRGLFVRTVVPFDAPFRVPTPANRRYRDALARLDALVAGIIAERARDATRHDDLLAVLLAATDGAGPPGEREIRDQLVTLLLTGVETTAMCLASAFDLLAENPEAERRLHHEADEVLTGHRTPDHDDLPRLGHTRRVITETLRVRPPGWIFTRITTRATELAGRRLPPGTIVLYSPYLLHHDPASFPDPDAFLPDRWLPERAAGVPGGAMLPFSAGNRKCVGDTLAVAEATVALAAVAAHWRLRRPPTRRPAPPRPAVTLGPRSLQMICEPRWPVRES
ncbi:cytochrome P450 [Streptomyces sp. NPDC057877]|uniref:cytochrome P450 n=1 Tax=Streptomyces sp. NPDC057877 TaxID=3346269 RepID=UPI00368C4E0F